MLIIPWRICINTDISPQVGSVVSNYESVIWQYSYVCVSQHNNYKITMERRITLLWYFTIYCQDEDMMISYDGELVPWEETEYITQIPSGSVPRSEYGHDGSD